MGLLFVKICPNTVKCIQYCVNISQSCRRNLSNTGQNFIQQTCIYFFLNHASICKEVDFMGSFDQFYNELYTWSNCDSRGYSWSQSNNKFPLGGKTQVKGQFKPDWDIGLPIWVNIDQHRRQEDRFMSVAKKIGQVYLGL